MTISIAISGGKGGVGKTIIATNLAIFLAKQRKKTLLVDADFGMANAHILLGINPSQGINTFLDGKYDIEDLKINVMDNLDLIPGGSGENTILNLDCQERGKFIRNIYAQRGDYDYQIVDTSAGASRGTLDFCAACNQFIVVIVGEPTSFLDAYSLIKAAHLDYGIDNFGVIVNQASNAQQGTQLYKKFVDITKKFISVNQRYIGYLPQTNLIKSSVINRKPALQSDKAAAEYEAFSTIHSNLKLLSDNHYSGLRL